MTVKPFVYALLSGCLLALAGPVVGWGPLVFVALVPLMSVLARRIPWRVAFLCGFLTGLPLYTSLVYWLWQHHPGITVLAIVALSLSYGLAALGVQLGVRARLRGIELALWMTCLWLAVEVFVGQVPLAPSCALGYALWETPWLIQGAAVVGVYGIGFWILALTSLMVVTWQGGGRNCRLGWIVVVILTVGFVVAGLIHPRATQRSLQVGVVQSAIDTATKTERPRIEATLGHFVEDTKHLAATASGTLDLVVWPETSVPVFLRTVHERRILETLTDCAARASTSILVGALAEDRDETPPGTFNTAFLVPSQGFIAQQYHKQQLVPFYEALPLRRWLPPSWREASPSLSAGREPGVFTLDDDRSVGTLICWEALSQRIVHTLARAGVGCLVNMTNDDAAFRQARRAYRIPLPHLVFRAVETRRSVVRCANRGTSLLVDPYGRIVTSLPWGQPDAVTWTVPYRSDPTFFVLVGYWLVYGGTLVTFGWGVCLAIRVRRTRDDDYGNKALAC